MERLVQIQVLQSDTGVSGLVGLDTQGQVWFGELVGAQAPAHYSVKWTAMEELAVDPEPKRGR
jgi:hypothetical protein